MSETRTSPDPLRWWTDEDVEVTAKAMTLVALPEYPKEWEEGDEDARENTRTITRAALAALSPRVAALVADAERAGADEIERLQQRHLSLCDSLDKAEAERDEARAALDRVRALADGWRYKGEFGWCAWQEGQGPDLEGSVLDEAASALLAALATPAPADAEDGGR